MQARAMCHISEVYARAYNVYYHGTSSYDVVYIGPRSMCSIINNVSAEGKARGVREPERVPGAQGVDPGY